MAKRNRKKGKNPNFKRPKYKKKQNVTGSTVQQTSNQQNTQQAARTGQINTAKRTKEINNLPEPPKPTLGIQDGKATIVLKATDTLFFRESRPMEAMGELQSTFPPSVQTLAGAVRTFIGDQQGVNWHCFNKDHELTNMIGYGDDLGALSFKGAWLAYQGERLTLHHNCSCKKKKPCIDWALAKKGYGVIWARMFI